MTAIRWKMAVLKGYEVHEVPLTSLNREALKDIEGLSTKDKDRCQNFFALGIDLLDV